MSLVAIAAFAAVADNAQTEQTMSVRRCQAKLDNGRQCKHQAGDDSNYCWRHRGFMKACKETADDTSNGAVKSWNSTKSWSTNAWNSTKSGAKEAWNATKDAFDGARVGMVELLGGKDAKKTDESKEK